MTRRINVTWESKLELKRTKKAQAPAVDYFSDPFSYKETYQYEASADDQTRLYLQMAAASLQHSGTSKGAAHGVMICEGSHGEWRRAVSASCQWHLRTLEHS